MSFDDWLLTSAPIDYRIGVIALNIGVLYGIVEFALRLMRWLRQEA
jgi:hypothetical protein